MKVLFAASECTPIAKVGGLGDVIGALPKTLNSLNIQTSVILPFYKNINLDKAYLVQKEFKVEYLGQVEHCDLYKSLLEDGLTEIYLIFNEKFLSNGGIYLSDDAIAVGDDEPNRFMFFCKAVNTLIKYGSLEFDVVHAHDWHTSFLLKLMEESDYKHAKKPYKVLSIHNLANKGMIESAKLKKEIDINMNYNSLIEVGIDFADKVVAVSKNYMAELLRGEFNEGLEETIQRNRDKFYGIVNGLDLEYFDPENDYFLSKRYDVSSYKNGKHFEKDKLYTELGWGGNTGKSMLIGFVGRIVKQKNIDLMIKAVQHLNNEDIKYVFLGVGDQILTDNLQNLYHKNKNHFYFANKFDERFARQIYAASDAFLVPSLFEPCGLTQMIAMRYGSIPIARRTGGLVDTITDGVDGFLFDKSVVSALKGTILKAHLIWNTDKSRWRSMVLKAMSKDFSWVNSAIEYAKLYDYNNKSSSDITPIYSTL